MTALLLSIAGLGLWEYVLRSNGIEAHVSDDKHLWAYHRARLHEATPEDIVILGSSRILFNLQLDVWEELDGRKPIQLAGAGRGPSAALLDIVRHTDFNGTLLVGCSPGLFFVPENSRAFGWWRGQEWVDHYYERTWAQRFNHAVDVRIQPYFSLLSGGEEPFDNDYNLETMPARLHRDERIEASVFFPRLNWTASDRNTRMWDIVERDTNYANQIIRFWTEGPTELRYAEEMDSILAYFQEAITSMEDRGGQIIFVRSPSHETVREREKITNPRDQYWDRLTELDGAKGIHFEDYDELKQFVTPEQSHLGAKDAEEFTALLYAILKDKNWIE